MSYPCILTEKQFTVYVFGIPKMIHSNNCNFEAVVAAYRRNDFDEILKLIDKKAGIETFCDGKIELRDNQLYYGEEILDNVLTLRLLKMKKEGFNVDPLVNFMAKLIKNPSYQSKQDLYRFLEHNNMPITEEGDFLGYKWVRDDYRDVHSGKTYNGVGETVEMRREFVDSDNTKTCSTGLHICSHKYTKFGARLLLCSISPEDVVAVPPDYNDSKMRVCKYRIIKEIPPEDYKDWAGPSVFSEEITDTDDFNDYDDEDTEDENEYADDELSGI